MATFDRAAARQAGYTDEEIDAFLQANPKLLAEPEKPESAEPPPPTTEINEVGKGAEAATIGAATAAGLGGAAALGAGAYGVRRAMTRIPQVTEAMQAMKQSMGQPAARPQPMPTPGPVQPTQSVLLDSRGRPMQMPQPMAQPQAQAQAQPGMMNRIAEMARTYGPAAARMAGGAAAMTMPSNAGQSYNFPQTGPMRGMEINPMTGRPWTRQELAAYERNPNAFNSGFAQQLNIMSR